MDDLNIKQVGAGAVVAALLSGGITAGVLEVQINDLLNEVDVAKTEKIAILSQYIYSQIRLGDLPTFDLFFVTSEEASAAYILAVKSAGGDTDNPDMSAALQQKAEEDKVVCKVPPEKQPIPVPIDPVPATP